MKKFTIVSSMIFICIITFFITFKIIFGDNILVESRTDSFINPGESIYTKYLGYENTDAGTNIIISIKNNSSSIVDFEEVNIEFAKKSNSNFDFKTITLKAVKKDWYDYYQSYTNISSGKEYQDKIGIDPGEEVEYLFYIPKGISFDTEIYDLNNMRIYMKGNTYKFRLSSNSLIGGFTSFGGSENIINNGEPIVIK